jgi:hypothetical protein
MDMDKQQKFQETYHEEFYQTSSHCDHGIKDYWDYVKKYNVDLYSNNTEILHNSNSKHQDKEL